MKILNVVIKSLLITVALSTVVLPLGVILYNATTKSIEEIIDRNKNYKVSFFETTVAGSVKVADAMVTNLEHKPDGMTCFHHLTEDKKLCVKAPILVVTPLELQ